MKEGTRVPTWPGFTYTAKTKTAVFRIAVPGTAQRRKRTVVGLTRDKALTAWRKFRDEVARPNGGPMTFRWYVETYGPGMRERVSKRTAVAEEQIIRSRLLPYFGDVLLDEINAALVRDFVGRLRRDGYRHEVEYTMRGRKHRRTIEGTYSPATINGTLAVLRKILRDAETRETIDRYPIRGKLPREKEEPLALELRGDEMERLLGAFADAAAFGRHVAETRSPGRVLVSARFGSGPRTFGGGRRPDSEWTAEAFRRFRWSRPLFVVALETGLSRSDLLGLTWRNVDSDRGVIRVPRQKTKVFATVPVSPACAEALAECRRRSVVGEAVFVTWEGRPYSVSTFERHFRLAKTLAGIERRFRIHDMRHSLGSRLATEGVPISDIARALGHTSSRMAERYARSAPDPALDRIRAALVRSAVPLNGPLNGPFGAETDAAEPIASGLTRSN